MHARPQDSSPRRAGVRLLTPDRQMVRGETCQVFLFPPFADQFDLRVRQRGRGELLRKTVESTRFELGEDFESGRYLIDARWRSDSGEWSQWSLPLEVVFHAEESEAVWRLRRAEHRLSLMIERDLDGVVTVIDPQGLPPHHPGGETEWFPTHVFEGVTTLVNEVTSYYEGPFDYYLDSLRRLRDRGVSFLTWHDLLDGRSTEAETAVLVQLDVDGGCHSVARLIPALLELGVRASLMVHAEAAPWYEYDLEQQPLDAYLQAQRAGWTVGYHNNSVGRARLETGLVDYGEEVMAAADSIFRRDLELLRAASLEIRTFTAHGGNVLNLKQPAPEGTEVVCVDRSNATLWQGVTSMFSDGGFLARPGPLAETLAGLGKGLHFVRNHPFKYANYHGRPYDMEPDVEAPEKAAQKQASWLEERRISRLGVRLARGSEQRPLSLGFASYSEVEERVTRLRASRRPFFLREYPEPQGDPRVFWWRLQECSVARPSRVVNVGALPPAMRVEHEAFLGPEVEVTELDVDPSREPDVLGSVTDPHVELQGSFDAALLFGLPYFADPRRAIDGCAALVRDGGLGLFGFPDDTHPMRGGLWNPDSRPVWRAHLAPLEDVGLKAQLWSFDPDSLAELFSSWRDLEIENFSHYWFCRARRA